MHARTLHSYIFATDEIRNRRNQYRQDLSTYVPNLMRFGHFYLKMWPKYLRYLVSILNATYHTIDINGVVCSVQNRNQIAQIFRKRYEFDLDAIC